MKLEIMTVLDKKARAFCSPFFVTHIAVGVRTFSMGANKPDTNVWAHPEDFALYHLGTFEDDSGECKLHPQPQHVAEAINLKKGVSDVQPKAA